MLNRVLEICEENRYLSLSRGFIVIQCGKEEVGKVPLDDIGVLLLSAQSVTFSKNILNALAEKGCITILCGKNYAPQSMVLPVYSHYHFAKVIKNQISASLPLKKRIWQQIVIQKIKNQALALKLCKKEESVQLIEKISTMVKSGDSENREAYAARMYWKALFGKDFTRDKDLPGVNSFLNYGYAIMRSAMARAVCSSGLIPSLGIHHDNNLNQFALADDLFEIYRPIVDCVVFNLFSDESSELTPELKKELTNVLWVKVHTSEGDSPAFQSMQYMAASYVHALEDKKAAIDIPVWTGDEYEATGT
ncbi:MAG: type II CRISPR-associated endonuclease Cas1 [Treponemataceae bacterium]|nr:type II CRISPR-associated endonuclease Cas1 [Treponemataceae bacterium]